jgi:hypothetical protein
MYPHISAFLRSVKGRGQLAQLSSCLRSLAIAATCVAAAVTMLVIGHPQKAFVLLREATLGHSHW